MITVTASNNTLRQFVDLLIRKPIQVHFQLYPLRNLGKIWNTPSLTELHSAVAIQEQLACKFIIQKDYFKLYEAIHETSEIYSCKSWLIFFLSYYNGNILLYFFPIHLLLHI